MNDNSMSERNSGHLNPLSVLIGSQLSSVEFVHDYVQLRFDGPYVTCYVWPTLISEGVSKHFGDTCYRDSLCSFISKEVKRVIENENQSIEIDFGNNESLVIPLEGNTDAASERVFFDSGKGPWASW